MSKLETIPVLAALVEDEHWWFATRTWAIEKWLDQLPTRKDLQILDIGCGAGNMIHHLSEYGSVQGIEVDPRPVKIALERGYDVRQGDATQGLPFPDNRFDLVTLLDVIEHVDADDVVLREAARVLKPAGYVLVTTPAFQWLWSYNDVLNAHKRRYTARALETRMIAAGLRAKRISYNFFFVFPLAAGLIVLRKQTRQQVDLSSHHFDQEAYQVEMEPAPPLLNSLLRGVGKVEAQLIQYVNLPIGTSLMCLAQKS